MNLSLGETHCFSWAPSVPENKSINPFDREQYFASTKFLRWVYELRTRHDATLRATLRAIACNGVDTRCNCCVKCCRSRTCFYSCNIARNIARNVASCVRSFSKLSSISFLVLGRYLTCSNWLIGWLRNNTIARAPRRVSPSSLLLSALVTNSTLQIWNLWRSVNPT